MIVSKSFYNYLLKLVFLFYYLSEICRISSER